MHPSSVSRNKTKKKLTRVNSRPFAAHHANMYERACNILVATHSNYLIISKKISLTVLFE